jgi:uncharacterized lipoprotein YbaY
MKPPTDRRRVLVAAGAAALAVATVSAAAQSTDIQGAVTFTGGAALPEGQLAVFLEDPTIQNSSARRIAKTRIDSDGGSTSISFSLSLPASLAASSNLRVVARLERADGWLLARGSAPFTADAPVAVTLKKAVY